MAKAEAPSPLINVDVVSLDKLQLEIIAPTVWGSLKSQPALLSVHLTLRDGFATAATSDALDQNTIHYGKLAKSIRERCDTKTTLETLFALVADMVGGMAMRDNGTCRLAATSIRVSLSQASMYSQNIEFDTTVWYREDGKCNVVERGVTISDMRLMVLIGVNAAERKMKQPLLVTLHLDEHFESDECNATHYNSAYFDVEAELTKVIQATSFETLEALATSVVAELKDYFQRQKLSCSTLQLRLQKPRAIEHAEGPVVEVIRRGLAKEHRADDIDDSRANQLSSSLKVIRPYV